MVKTLDFFNICEKYRNFFAKTIDIIQIDGIIKEYEIVVLGEVYLVGSSL